jgi:allantoinase
MTHAFLSTRIVTPEGTRPGALVVEGQRIRTICAAAEVPSDAVRHNCGTAAILPGLVDTHVHINEPGRTEWEGFWTGTRAAAAGGYTTIVDMPLNCLPETTTVAALEAKRAAAAGKCFVDWAAWGGAVSDNQDHILPLARAGVPGFKCFLIYPGCDGFGMIDRAQLEASLPAIAESGLPLLVHAELAGPIDAACARLVGEGADWREYATYLASRPDEAEVQAIELLLALCRRYRFRLHIVHLATCLAVPAIARAKEEGLPVTVETCPHYLHFAAEDVAPSQTLLKCAPPIRDRANREALWQALADGVIDLVATDHSPCPPEMKESGGRFDRTWGGIASLSVALAVMHTECRSRGYDLGRMVQWMGTAPAGLAGISDRVGALVPGRDASFTIFDTEAERTVTADALHTRHAISPYVGERLTGRVQATYLRGACVWSGNGFEEQPRGREITLC